jgi:hypothetical protein
MQKVIMKIGRENNGKLYFAFMEGRFYFLIGMKHFSHIKIGAGIYFGSQRFGVHVIGLVEHSDLCILHFIGEGKSKKYDLDNWHTQEYEHGLPIPEYVAQFFFYQ